MRIVLDENVPVELVTVLQAAGHVAQSVNFIGWKGLKNGEILMKAAAGFELLVTRDKDFDIALLHSYAGRSFGVVLLSIPQQKGSAYADAFTQLWPEEPENLVGKITRLGVQSQVQRCRKQKPNRQ